MSGVRVRWSPVERAARALTRRTPHELMAESPIAMPTIRETVTKAEPVAIHLWPTDEVALVPMGPRTKPRPRPATTRLTSLVQKLGSTDQRLTKK